MERSNTAATQVARRACAALGTPRSHWPKRESSRWSVRALRCRTDRFDDKAASYCSCTNATKYSSVLAGFRSELRSRDQPDKETEVTFPRRGERVNVVTRDDRQSSRRTRVTTRSKWQRGEPAREHQRLHFSRALAALIGGRYVGE